MFDLSTVTASGITGGGLAILAVKWGLASNEDRISALETVIDILKQSNKECEARYTQVRATLDSVLINMGGAKHV